MVVVRGKVVGADDVVLPGVTVLLKGTVTGVTTDAEGKYSIFVPKKGATLIFSFVGMKTKEVVCGDKREINVRWKRTCRRWKNGCDRGSNITQE